MVRSYSHKGQLITRVLVMFRVVPALNRPAGVVAGVGGDGGSGRKKPGLSG